MLVRNEKTVVVVPPWLNLIMQAPGRANLEGHGRPQDADLTRDYH
jgi:hypothetical protein